MAVGINGPVIRPSNNESDLDKLAKLLNIGANGYGIYDAMGRRALANEQASRDKTTFDQAQNEIAQNKDATSEASAIARRNAKLAGLNVNENDTAYSLGQNAKTYGPLIESHNQLEQKKYERDVALGKRNQDLANDLRKEVSGHKVIKDTQDVTQSWNKIQSSAGAPSAAGDLALLYNFNKMLDPGSTVREGEFANAQNTAGIDQRLIGLRNRLLNGERLSDAQRADFLGQAQNIYNSQRALQNQLYSQYHSLATQYGVDPKQVLFNVEASPLHGLTKKQEALPTPEGANLNAGMPVPRNMQGKGKSIQLDEIERELIRREGIAATMPKQRKTGI